jgi:hypothetical protein
MSQNDYIIANQTAPAFRADLNNALQALASLSSGSSQPATTYANMLWYDTGTNILKMRTEADDAWANIGYLDQTANAFRILEDTQVVDTSGSQIGLIGGQATATWEAGVSTTESLISPAKIRAAISAVPYTTFDLLKVSAGFNSTATGNGITIPDDSTWNWAWDGSIPSGYGEIRLGSTVLYTFNDDTSRTAKGSFSNQTGSDQLLSGFISTGSSTGSGIRFYYWRVS